MNIHIEIRNTSDVPAITAIRLLLPYICKLLEDDFDMNYPDEDENKNEEQEQEEDEPEFETSKISSSI